MRHPLAIFIFSVLVSAMVLVAGCSKTVYVCVNGVEVEDKAKCAVNKLAAVTKDNAESYATRFVTAYFTPYGGKVQIVSSYLDASTGDYLATFVVADKSGTPYQTVLSIDGVTGKVTCKEKCDYANAS
jgi:hypothetical protein